MDIRDEIRERRWAATGGRSASEIRIIRATLDPVRLRKLATYVDLARLRREEDPAIIALGLDEVRLFLTTLAAAVETAEGR
jgi:hypothetical protein